VRSRGVRSGRADATRERILEAAERLFAERGLDKVSLNEVNREAGQRNTAAVFYHFRSKEVLVESLLLRHQTGIDNARRKALGRLQRAGVEASLRDLVRILVDPLIAKLDEPSGRAYIRIQAQLEPIRSRPMPATRLLMREIDRRVRGDAVGPATSWKPLFVTILLFHALAHQAREEERNGALGRGRFVGALLDSMVAMIRSPDSGEDAGEA